MRARYSMDTCKATVERSQKDAGLRLIAFYLPQFHPIQENDEWWGEGFTEWRNVVQAKPLFKGHYQPHLPADLGFYDLRVPETREQQAELAQSYGISGFCYYHYWFNGRRLLNRPFDEVLGTGRPLLPFCLCWANENWTRRWDGMDNEILIKQDYSAEDDRAHAEYLVQAFKDERYIKIDGRPLFLVYRTARLPEPARTAEIWRKACKGAGFPDCYLATVQGYHHDVDPSTIGFDAAVEFAPHWQGVPPRKFRRREWDLIQRAYNALQKAGLLSWAYRDHRVFSYRGLAERMAMRPQVPYKRLRCVTPGWDNSPRRKQRADIFDGSTPELYEQWLRTVAEQTLTERIGDERIVFVNAWNEWAEGNHLEPDLRWGRAYLEATQRAVEVARRGGTFSLPPERQHGLQDVVARA
jgi:lipopolysaccharide biosynthesis protein